MKGIYIYKWTSYIGVEGWSITMVNGTNIIQLTRMADEYLDMSQSADVKFYEAITQKFEYIGNSVYCI